MTMIKAILLDCTYAAESRPPAHVAPPNNRRERVGYLLDFRADRPSPPRCGHTIELGPA
jgi:hypothetical protein